MQQEGTLSLSHIPASFEVVAPPCQGAFMAHYLMWWLRRWWWIPTLIMLGPVGLWVYTDNIAWLLVSAMLLCLCYPMMLYLILARYALHVDGRRAMHSAQVTLTPSTLSIHYLPLDEDHNHAPEDIIVPRSEIREWGVGGKHIHVVFGPSPHDFIALPLSEGA